MNAIRHKSIGARSARGRLRPRPWYLLLRFMAYVGLFLLVPAALEGSASPADLAYADLESRLEVADAKEVNRFLSRHQGSVAAERLRELWLRRLVRERRWSDYLAAHVDNGSTERDCWHRRALLGTGQPVAAFAGLADLYLTGRSLPSDCDPLFAIWSEVGGLRSELVWARIERALYAGNPGVAAFQARYLPAEQEPWLELMLAVHRRPSLLLEEAITSERSRCDAATTDPGLWSAAACRGIAEHRRATAGLNRGGGAVARVARRAGRCRRWQGPRAGW